LFDFNLYVANRTNDRGELPASANYVQSMGITSYAVGVAHYIRDELKVRKAYSL